MTAVPIFLPADPGIGAPEVAAESTMTREFMPEIKILQRERSFDYPSWLFTVAGLVVLACSLILIAALSWGAGRINNKQQETGARTDTRPTVQPQT